MRERLEDGDGGTDGDPARAFVALRASEEEFRLLVSSVKDYAIFLLDPVGIVRSWNLGAERIKGYSADEVIGRHFSLFYPQDDIRAGKCEHELEVASRTGSFEDLGWRLRKDGSRFFANVVITALRDESGRLRGFAKVTRDLTEHRKAEEMRLELAKEQVARQAAETRERERAALVAKLEEANRLLAEANERLEQTNAALVEAVRARDDFLTIASHELKTPLYTLEMQVSSGLWLIDKKDAPKDHLRKRMEGAQTAVHRLNRLLHELLDVSRIAANRLTFEPEPVELGALAREVLDRDRDDIARSGSSVTLEAPEEIRGVWDKLRLDQVLTNLLSNALKYGEHEPVVVRVERAGDRARIAVTDHGLGIDAVDQARIFERFERAVSSRNHSGFGLGLWIVKRLVDGLGGTITVESRKGEGSTFAVELPIAPRAGS